jgi:phosphoribosylglycinamide formyltransferase-1
MKKLGILLSGRGSNFEAIARNVKAGKIPAEIAVVISNKEDALGLAHAKQMGLATRFIPSKGKEREAFDREVVAVLREFQVDLVCLAGFMRILSPYFIREFHGRILNIHPALLPAFPGEEAQRQALEHGVKFTGCTVHLVDEGVDTGPIVCQAIVPVLDDDTVDALSARILKEEHRIYSEAICLLLEERVRVEGRRVVRKSGPPSAVATNTQK